MKKNILFLLLSFCSLFAFEDLTLENFEEKTSGKNIILKFYAKT